MISICIATYNGGPYIQQQLSSILEQLSPADEVIISDDGSTDDTLSVIQQMAQQSACPIRLFHNTGEHGYVANFEHALRQAQGEYIFLADQDDVWLPGKVEVMMQALKQGASLVVSNASIADGTLHITAPDYFAARGVRQGLLGNFIKFGYLGCCFALHRRVLHLALPFPANHRFCTHDNWLFLCAQARYRVQIIRQPLMLYRRHGDTSTTGALNAHKSLLFRIRYRLYLAWHLLLRLISVR